MDVQTVKARDLIHLVENIVNKSYSNGETPESNTDFTALVGKLEGKGAVVKAYAERLYELRVELDDRFTRYHRQYAPAIRMKAMWASSAMLTGAVSAFEYFYRNETVTPATMLTLAGTGLVLEYVLPLFYNAALGLDHAELRKDYVARQAQLTEQTLLQLEKL